MSSKSKPTLSATPKNHEQLIQPHQPSAKKQSLDPHRCTGKFKEDFEHISKLKNIQYLPEIICRGKLSIEKSGDNGENSNSNIQIKAGKGVKPILKQVAVENPQDTIVDKPPTTYSIVDSLEYFKPRITVEMDNPDKNETVTEIHIKGWKIEKIIFDVFQIVLPNVDRLHTLRKLIIDGNPLHSPQYHSLFYEDNSNLQTMCLRNNQLDDEAIKLIAYGLGDFNRQNQKLINLQLCSNQISDQGAIYLANALRTNRTLLTLNLANNQIGDIGAKALADVLAKFELVEEEILYRRKLYANYEKSLSPTRSAVISSTSMENKKKPSVALKDREPSDITQGSASGKTSSKAKKDEKKPGDKRNSKRTSKPLTIRPIVNERKEVNLALLKVSALADSIQGSDGRLWLIGNRNLIVLNLSRNNLTEVSICGFIAALENQKLIMEANKNRGNGLMRLIIENNKFDPENEAYLKLLEILKSIDPHAKPFIESNDDSKRTTPTANKSATKESKNKSIKH